MNAIYRAICHSNGESMEAVVFIHATSTADAASRLPRVLAQVWNVPADTVAYYNLDSEAELLARSSEPETGDMRLFESGWSKGRVSYTDKPLMLLRPDAHARLMSAWATLPPRGLFHRALPMQKLSAEMWQAIALLRPT